MGLQARPSRFGRARRPSYAALLVPLVLRFRYVKLLLALTAGYRVESPPSEPQSQGLGREKVCQMIWKSACKVWAQLTGCATKSTTRGQSRRHHATRETVEVAPPETLEARLFPSALSIVIDYSYDTNNFFDTQEKRDLFQQAADIYAARIVDNLTAISPSGTNTWSAEFTDPATGETVQKPSLYVPTDTLIVFAGGRDLDDLTLGVGGPGGYSASGSGTWLATVNRRGQSGAALSRPNDFGPWGGSVTFDTSGTDWFFGTTIVGIGAGQADFLSVATHEMGHILGFGTSNAFDTFVNGDRFNGPKSTAAYDNGGNPPLASDDSHWANGTQDDGQETAMDPSIALGSRKLLTSLDWAALDDLGWTLTASTTSPSPAIVLSGSIPTFFRGGARRAFDPMATFNNPGALSLKGAQLQVSMLANVGKYDALTIGVGNGITKSGATLKFNGVSIGTYSNGLGKTPFKLTFNSKATDAAVQACLRNLQFYTTSSQAGTLDRILSVRMLNMNGQNSAPDTQVVHVV